MTPEFVHELLSNMYRRLCSCRFNQGVNLHYEAHEKNCRYRQNIEHTEIRKIFDDIRDTNTEFDETDSSQE